MDVTLFMAMSVNGIIALEDGSEEFLSHENWKSFSKLVDEFGCFVVGGNTYKAVKGWEWGYGFDDFTDAKKVVITDDKDFSVDEGYELATSPQGALEKLSGFGFKRALLSGGAYTNTLFMNARLVKTIILNIEPAVIGRGMRLFSAAEFQTRLRLVKTEKLADDIVQLRYEVA
jgi:dihydrofolate reductase